MTLFSFSGVYSNNCLVKPLQNSKKVKYGENRKVDAVENVKWIGVLENKYHPPSCDMMIASDSGMSDEDVISIACNCDGQEEIGIKNVVLNTGLHSIIEKLIDKDNLNTTDGFISHLEIGLSDTTAVATQTGTILPVARKPIVEATRNTTNAVFKTFFNGGQANSFSTTVSIGTSTTQFNVLSGTASGFSIGESITVDIGGSPETTEITNIASDTIQVFPALSATPSGGETVKQLFTELTLWGTSGASDSLGTGVCFARTTNFTPRSKDSGYGMTIEWHITLT